MSSRAWVIRLVLVAIVLTAAGVAALALQGEGTAPAGAQGQKPAPVVTAVVDEGELTSQRRYLGEIRATSKANLTVGEAGRVKAIHVREGDRVTPGQLLLELDDRLARAELGQARATQKSLAVEGEHAARRTKEFEKLEKLEAAGPGETDQEATRADSLAAQSQAARAQMAAQSQRVLRHRIEAPFEGVVSRRAVDPGDWLTPGQAALELVTDNRAEIHVRVPAELLDQLDDVVEISVQQGDRRVGAELEGVVGALDPATRTALLRLLPEAQPRWLRPGASAEVSFEVTRGGGVVVPRDALVHGIHDVRVVRVQAGKAEHVVVTVLAEDAERALVEAEGLEKGDVVVIRGNERLRPGQPVTTEGVTAAAASSG